MSDRRLPSIAASLPGRSVPELRAELRAAREAGADLAEIRVDRLTDAGPGSVDELFPAELPLIATYRSRAEGGHGATDAAARGALLLGLAARPFRFLDLELARDLPLRPELARALDRPGAPTPILSAHLPQGTAPSVLHQLVADSVRPGAIVKVVLPADIGELLEEILPQLPPPGLGTHVVLTTGRSGPLLRALSRRLQAPLVYAALPERPAVEPAQIRADRLRNYFRGPEGAPLFGVAGRSVARSRSPELHHAWMDALGLAGLYLPLEFVEGGEFLGALPHLAACGFRGVNVTHPFKIEALEAADRAGPAAERAGCANLLTFEAGTVTAENTDVAAMIQRLGELRAARARGIGRVTILGSGGAARAALAAAEATALPAEIRARNPARAGELAREFGAEVGRDRPAEPADLLIQATPAGTPGAPTLEVDLDGLLGPGSHVLDYVYDPQPRSLEERARRSGATYEDGSRLLVYQAALSFETWWSRQVPDELLRASLPGAA